MEKRIVAAFGLAACLAVAAVWPAAATAGVPRPAGGPLNLGGAAVADSLRTNLWLVEALMGEIAGEVADALPPAPQRVLLAGKPAANDPAGELLRQVATRVLRHRGYTVLADEPDSLHTPADCTAWLSADLVDLRYPDVGRTLGLWRRWVDRDLAVTVSAEVSERGSGQLLLSDRLTRRFCDRVASDEFPRVESRLYPFTAASPSESGWSRRLEEFVVLGTLAGLVAVYFANTGD